MSSIIKHFYLHVPFCTSRCGYCSFYTEPFSLTNKSEYLTTVTREIDIYQERYTFNPRSIYFGGGTPSLLLPHELQEILNCFSYQKTICEITLECNPITLTDSYLEELSTTDINRVSLGIQSFNPLFLKYLNRKHSPELVERVVSSLRKKGFKNVSGDLIYGIPHQTLEDLEADIEKFIQLDLDHISIYCLSLDNDAKLYSDVKKLPQDELVSDMYNLICEKLDSAGFEQYEISNFAKLGHQSKHNRSYWEQEDYLGIGAGAFGTLDNIRYNNNDFKAWVTDIRDEQIILNIEELSYKDKLNEYIMLSLRLNKGVDLVDLKRTYHYDLTHKKESVIAKYLELNLLEMNEKRLCLTAKSRFISNYIISELMED